MIIGIGVDIVKTARFEGMTPPFMARVFTPEERAYFASKGHISAAGFFSAKEAVAKALGTGFSGFWPDQIEVVHDKQGRPGIILHKEAAGIAQRLAGSEAKYHIDISISHTDTDAIAFAIISCC